jgi:hypothetical protein
MKLLSDQQRLNLIESEQIFQAWREADWRYMSGNTLTHWETESSCFGIVYCFNNAMAALI